MTAKPPDPAALLRRLPEPELDVDQAEDDDLRRIELRRVVLEVAEIDHAAEIAEVTDVTETGAVAKALGMDDALNLDGGGSTTMVVGGEVVNQPSDATGERPVGDALLVLPRRP